MPKSDSPLRDYTYIKNTNFLSHTFPLKCPITTVLKFFLRLIWEFDWEIQLGLTAVKWLWPNTKMPNTN